MRIRGQDYWGSGAYGSSRGDHIHEGVDIIAKAGKPFYAITQGEVTKLGHAYPDDLSYRYVELTDRVGGRWRYFYVEPSVKVGDKISAYEKIGTVQNIQDRYDKRMTMHVHFEIINAYGDHIDPTPIIKDR